MTLDCGGCLLNCSETRDEFGLDRNPAFPFSCLIVTCHNKTLTCLDKTGQRFLSELRKLFLMPSKYQQQAEEIQRICEDAGLPPEEMASRVALKWDSMRKIINGYQPCSPQLMQSFRNVAEMEKLRRQTDVVIHSPGAGETVLVEAKFAQQKDTSKPTVKSKKTSEHIGAERVQRLVSPTQPISGRIMKYPSDVETGGSLSVLQQKLAEAKEELERIADADPVKAREILNVVMTYGKGVRKSKKPK